MTTRVARGSYEQLKMMKGAVPIGAVCLCFANPLLSALRRGYHPPISSGIVFVASGSFGGHPWTARILFAASGRLDDLTPTAPAITSEQQCSKNEDHMCLG